MTEEGRDLHDKPGSGSVPSSWESAANRGIDPLVQNDAWAASIQRSKDRKAARQSTNKPGGNSREAVEKEKKNKFESPKKFRSPQPGHKEKERDRLLIT